MSSISSQISDYVDQVSRIGGEVGPVAVKAMILLVLVLLLVKALGKIMTSVLVRTGMPERRAAYSVTVVHILVLIVGALIVLNLVGFPGVLLFRVVMVIVMAAVAVYIISKPYLPRLPFKKGDVIKTGSALGTVDSITVMNTGIRTFDGKMIIVPNHKILNDQLTNSSARPNRRMDINFYIPYDQDVSRVRGIVMDILKEDKRVLEKPAARVVIAKFSPDCLEMQARLWVERKHILTGRWDLNERIKTRFDEEGIPMASPRLEIRDASSQSNRAA